MTHVRVLLSFQQPTFQTNTTHQLFFGSTRFHINYLVLSLVSSEVMKGGFLKLPLDHPMNDVPRALRNRVPLCARKRCRRVLRPPRLSDPRSRSRSTTTTTTTNDNIIILILPLLLLLIRLLIRLLLLLLIIVWLSSYSVGAEEADMSSPPSLSSETEIHIQVHIHIVYTYMCVYIYIYT